ncbi:hypothetical protein H0H92_006890 [Tricholoma furcatifolium]|nr:hypothetical protein H0H92_006890 [Tricholoma furcatifolium]
MSGKQRAIWDTDTDRILINALLKQRDDGMQTSNGNWHSDTWTAAEQDLSGTEHRSGGAVKTSATCQTRWAAIKAEYRIVKQLRELSGFGWDEEKKWSQLMITLIPHGKNGKKGTYATGAGVFRPGRDFTPETEPRASDDEQNIHPMLRSSSSNSVLLVERASSLSASTLPVTPSPASAPPISARKREAAEEDEPGSSKRSRGHGRRQSSGQALSGMASSIAQLASSLVNDTVVPSPQRKQAAVRIIEDDGDLSEEEQIKVFKIIRRDTSFADTLLAIKKKSTRTHFIQSELNSE